MLWWTAQTPSAAVLEDAMVAEAAASVRNALLVTVSGRDVRIDHVQDWYRRDDDGRPMPAEWRDLVGQIPASRRGDEGSGLSPAPPSCPVPRLSQSG